MSGSIDYVLPLRWTTERPRDEVDELTDYLRELSTLVNVIVVDGSPADAFERHHAMWGQFTVHVAPDPSDARNGKVAGVHTGMRHATADEVVVADDDVRYDETTLRRAVALLARADLVGPQNVFDPLPWHAAWDSARSLLNRAVAADYPGTFAVRRATFLAMGGYDGDVLFENLELMRTVRAHGGIVIRPRDLYVRRLPPSFRHFAGQRVRQAYDDVAQPWRLGLFLPLLPAALSGRRGRRLTGAVLAGSVAVAEVGRRRGGGAARFPAYIPLFAPAWVTERAVCSWLAVAQGLLLGGVRYGDRRLGVAAHSPRLLRKAAGRRALVATRRGEPAAVGAVAERLESGPAASAQGHGASPRRDLPAVDVGDGEVAAQQQRAVGVGRDGGLAASRRLDLSTTVPKHAPDAAPRSA